MKHKDIRRRDIHRIALERELLWLGIALALYIAASAVGAVYVNLPKWATLILAIVPIVIAAVTLRYTRPATMSLAVTKWRTLSTISVPSAPRA